MTRVNVQDIQRETSISLVLELENYTAPQKMIRVNDSQLSVKDHKSQNVSFLETLKFRVEL